MTPPFGGMVTKFRRTYVNWPSTNGSIFSSELGGLEPIWNFTFEVLDSSNYDYGILLIGVVKERGLEVHIFNCYGPYEDCKKFWESKEMKALLVLP